MTIGHLKFGFFVYWALFGLLAVFLTDDHGLAVHPDQIPFPWVELIVTEALLAAVVSLLYLGLRSTILNPDSGISRVFAALLLSITMLVVATFETGADEPGLSYIPVYFAFVTTLLLCLALLLKLGATVWRKMSGSP